MFQGKLSRCPACGADMEKGFSVRSHGLSWVPAQKMQQFAFMDKDLNKAGWRKYFPSTAAYDLSYHCADCKIYVVDYSRSFSRAAANALAESVS